MSILCLILTFLLYSVLPQLRDLTGKFILGICGCSVAAFSLILIDIFGSADENVHNLTTGRNILAFIKHHVICLLDIYGFALILISFVFILEFLLHTSIVCLWLCLNCMGHHVWQIIRSGSVFTRISDGKRYLGFR